MFIITNKKPLTENQVGAVQQKTAGNAPAVEYRIQ
jgi:hypothetical protein